ncbi:hypothetical protein FORC066_4000 [Yersinia enterocolitica]|nr:hypothetical protein FORC066_4000 [Yersinia enterocolitica]
MIEACQPLIKSSKSLVLQQGSKRTNPDELTQVSDSGA